MNVNPETRFKIPQIRASKWFNLSKTKHETKGIIVGKDQIVPNEMVIKRMKDLPEKPDYYEKVVARINEV